MIQATIQMTMPPQRSCEVLDIIRPVMDLCEIDPGCLGCHVYNDLKNKGDLLLVEYWNAQEDLDQHIRSMEYRNLLLALELAPKRPEICFHTITETTGIETIEKARGQRR